MSSNQLYFPVLLVFIQLLVEKTCALNELFAQPKQGIPKALGLAGERWNIGSVCSGTSRQGNRAGWMQMLIRMTP